MGLAIARHNINYGPAEYIRLVSSIFSSVKRSETTDQFEKDFIQYLGVKFGFSFASGSAALYHGIGCTDLKAGDKILFPSYEFSSVPETLRLCGLAPVFVPVDKLTGNVTAEGLAASMSTGVRACLVANIHGRPAPLEAIRKFCNERKLLMIEDCAHSAGASIGGKKTGAFGDFAIFSFGPGKTLACGGGGFVATSDEALAEKLKERWEKLVVPPWAYEAKRLAESLVKGLLSTRLLFTCTLFPALAAATFLTRKVMIDRFFSTGFEAIAKVPQSYHYQFTDASAKIGLLQLQRLDALNAQRRKNAEVLQRRLGDAESLTLPAPAGEATHAYLNYPVVFDRPAQPISLALLRKGIDTRKDYLLDFSENAPQGVVPVNTLYLPNHPGLNESDMERVAQAVLDQLSLQR